MDPEIQVHILNNLKELNENHAEIRAGQVEICTRLDKLVPWFQGEIGKVDGKVETARDDISEMQKWQAVSSWKLGTLSAGAGAVLSFAMQWLASKFGFKLT